MRRRKLIKKQRASSCHKRRIFIWKGRIKETYKKWVIPIKNTHYQTGTNRLRKNGHHNVEIDIYLQKTVSKTGNCLWKRSITRLEKIDVPMLRKTHILENRFNVTDLRNTGKDLEKRPIRRRRKIDVTILRKTYKRDL